MQVCDYNRQCSVTSVAFATHPSLQGLKVLTQERYLGSVIKLLKVVMMCVDRSVMNCKTDLCVKVLKWEVRCTEAIPLSWPGKSWSSVTENRYDGRLPGCSGWLGLLWVPYPALGTPTTLAATAFTPVGSSGELFRLFCQESGFACSRADNPIQTHRGFETRRLPLTGLASLPKPVPRVWPLLHATVMGSHRWELSGREGPVADKVS